jgi:hypothetical protein
VRGWLLFLKLFFDAKFACSTWKVGDNACAIHVYEWTPLRMYPRPFKFPLPSSSSYDSDPCWLLRRFWKDDLHEGEYAADLSSLLLHVTLCKLATGPGPKERMKVYTDIERRRKTVEAAAEQGVRPIDTPLGFSPFGLQHMK